MYLQQVNRPSILVVVPYGIESSGTVVFARRLIQEWRTQGIRCDLAFCSQRVGNAPGLRFADGLALFAWVEARIRSRSVAGLLWCGVFYDGRSRDKQVDISRLARLNGSRVVLIWERSGTADAFLEDRLLCRMATDGVDAIVALNHEHMDYLVSKGVPSDMLHLFSTGIDTRDEFTHCSGDEKLAIRAELGLPEDEVIVLWVGRFTARKRPDFLAEVWKRIQVPQNTLLLMIGSGFSADDSVEYQLEKITRNQSGLQIRTYFEGMPLALYYRAADIFTLTGTREGEPTVLCEAMASGLPIIANDVSAHTRLVRHMETGLLYSSNSAEELVRVLKFLVADKNVRTELGARARMLAKEQRDIAVVASKYLQLINPDAAHRDCY